MDTDKIYNNLTTREGVKKLLRASALERQEIYELANTVRHKSCGDEILKRGLVEFSNICHCNCHYCGIRAKNTTITRYQLTTTQILTIAKTLRAHGAGTIVLQSGEILTPQEDEMLCQLIHQLKSETDLAVTLSVGARPPSTYKAFKEAGADRYLIRFETSSPHLYSTYHPDSTLAERLSCIRTLKSLGFETGSGFLIGLPGETDDILADNLLLTRTLNLDMIGIGPFIPSPNTPLSATHNRHYHDQDIFFLVLSLLRLINPNANIPATTAYDALFPSQGRTLALSRGANVIMPNFTPAPFSSNYTLYPGKK